MQVQFFIADVVDCNCANKSVFYRSTPTVAVAQVELLVGFFKNNGVTIEVLINALFDRKSTRIVGFEGFPDRAVALNDGLWAGAVPIGSNFVTV